MLKTILLSAATAFAIAVSQAQAQDQPPPPDQDKFVAAQTPDQWLSTEILGRQVQNLAGEDMGDIDYLLVDESNRVVAAVIGVGGFLGIGRKVVAIKFDAISRRRVGDGQVELLADVTEEALDAAPGFKRSPVTRPSEHAEDPAGQMTSTEAQRRAGQGEARKEAEQTGDQSGASGSAQQ
jgi:hypothetical protein